MSQKMYGDYRESKNTFVKSNYRLYLEIKSGSPFHPFWHFGLLCWGRLKGNDFLFEAISQLVGKLE